MILKIRDDRPCNHGWWFKEGVSTVHVDGTSWHLAWTLKGTNDDPHDLPYGFFGIAYEVEKETKKETEFINRSVRFQPSMVLFDARGKLEHFQDDNDFVSIKVVSIEYRDGRFETLVTDLDVSAWLMNDDGKTIERL